MTENVALEQRTGGAILADALIGQGARWVTCVPGESFLAFLDAAWDRQDRLRILACRHEAPASHMAEAMGRLTGRPGICFVTRGPGACHGAIGVHSAAQASTPMILLVGAIPTAHRDREAFQEVDLAAMFTPLAKHVEVVDTPSRIGEAVARAFAQAMGGRPGPVVLIFPEDVLTTRAAAPDYPPMPVTLPTPNGRVMARLAEMLAAASRPLAIVGGGGWTEAAAHRMTDFAQVWHLPVAASFRCQDIVDNEAPIYAGELGFSMSPSLRRRLGEADLVLAIGARLSDVDTQGYSLLSAPLIGKPLIHVFPEAEELGRVYLPDLGIVSAMAPFAEALGGLKPPYFCRWRSWTDSLNQEYRANLIPDPCPGALDLGRVMTEMEELLPPDTILCNGAGNYTGWPQRFHRFRRFGTQLAPIGGAMGYGLPAALAAKVVFPERTVVAFAGDGCFMMASQELATAKLHDLAVIVIVMDNSMFGTIRMHQEREHPGRPVATHLANPDFAALARSFGFEAETIRETGQFPSAFRRALKSGRSSLLHLIVDPDAITTRTTLNSITRASFPQGA